MNFDIPSQPSFDNNLAQRLIVFAGVLGLHLAAVIFLWQIKPAREAITHVATLMVSIVQPEPETAPSVVIELPKPLPVAPKPKPIERAAPPKLETPMSAPSSEPSAIELPPTEPAALIAESVTPSAAPETPTPPVPATPPPPIVQPNFNADYLNNPPPDYPAMSRRMDEQGRVLLRVLVDTSGSPRRVEINNSSGFVRLDLAAQDVVMRWRFVPARQGDKNIVAWVLVPIQFKLD